MPRSERPGPAPTGSLIDRGPTDAPNVRKWRLRVPTGERLPSGGYVKASREFRGTKKEATRELARFLREVQADTKAAAARTRHGTVDDLLVRWIDHARTAEQLSPNTIRGYRHHISRHIKPAIGHRRVDELTTAQLDHLYGTLAAAGYAPKTVWQVHAIIRRALRQGQIWGLVDRNVATLAAKPRQDPSEITPPTLEQLTALQTAADELGPDHGLLVALATATGARRAELCALRFDDIDWAEATVTIRRTTALVDHEVVTLATKTRRSRTIALDPATMARLEAQRAAHEWEWVFVQRSGQPWVPDRASARYAAARAAAAIHTPAVATIRLHDLRHWHATALLDAGVPLADVAGRLGHTTPTTTLNVYAHRAVARDRQAADIIAKLRSS